MDTKINQLTNKNINQLKEAYDLLFFPKDFHLVYEKQIPNAGIALIEGKIEVIKNKKLKEVLIPGCLIGLHHILNGEPLNYDCKIKKDSKIILLGKSDLLDCVINQKSLLFKILKKYLHSTQLT